MNTFFRLRTFCKVAQDTFGSQQIWQ